MAISDDNRRRPGGPSLFSPSVRRETVGIVGAIMLMVAILVGLWLYAGGVLQGAYRADGPKAEESLTAREPH
jgi:hypothetical protein